MDTTSILCYLLPQFIHFNNNDNNQYEVIIRPLYVNMISPMHEFDAFILSSVPREMVNQLRQMIETCKSMLDIIVELR